MSTIISFSVDDLTARRLEFLAGLEGLSVGAYLTKELAGDDEPPPLETTAPPLNRADRRRAARAAQREHQ